MNPTPQSDFSVWVKRLGFYFAALGMGFGLGNLWRFPYVVYENGGGAFVLLYLFFAFLLGLPVLISELLIGKITKKPIMSALSSKDTSTLKTWDSSEQQSLWMRKIFSVFGTLSVIMCMLVLTYFAVISGWVLHFLVQFVTALFSGGEFNDASILSNLRQNGLLQVVLTSAHLMIVIIVASRDKEQEKERWVGYIIPAFIILILLLAWQSLSMENSEDAIRFLFYPDFSKLKLSSPAEALGHLLFTLSLGFGVMVTFGNFLKPETYVPRASLQVVYIDTFSSVFAGLMIFPLVISTTSHFSGPELLFQTVPILLSQINGGTWFGAGFFLCLYIASVGSSIGLLETIGHNFKRKLKIKKSNAVWLGGAICLVVSFVPAFSSNIFSHVFADRGGVLRIIDSLLINWMLPVLCLVLSQVLLYAVDSKVLKEEFIDENSPTTVRLYHHWRFLLKYIFPLVVLICLILQSVSLFV